MIESPFAQKGRILGSVSQSVVQNAPCSVLVIREEEFD
ncbi:MAG: universal stress protein [Pyrinomonadaceae bacterium]